ncbi:hypothetical protein Cgig2_005158 [Carnegiea gigantea]|uniref:P53 and DNA damage-regulated protein 1 n=1 Tax=Carnegiea gigantea TaxID=171969 RepID=A0A9Q1KG45_9CARY|nr:hypothetical protein Cgig2_005158 [Carnegiea gigantea]
MDGNVNEYQEILTKLEIEAEHLLLARHQVKFLSTIILLSSVVQNDRLRNANREALTLTALRKKARTTKTSVPSPFEPIMKEIGGLGSKPLIQEVCTTCENHDPTKDTWMMLPGTDIFAVTPFHAAHTILERVALTYSIVGVSHQERLDFEAKKLQSIVKDQSLIILEKGALSDKISRGILRVWAYKKLQTASGYGLLLSLLGSNIRSPLCPNISSSAASEVEVLGLERIVVKTGKSSYHSCNRSHDWNL